MKILIISQAFRRNCGVGTIRVSKLTKYLSDMGEVTLIATKDAFIKDKFQKKDLLKVKYTTAFIELPDLIHSNNDTTKNNQAPKENLNACYKAIRKIIPFKKHLGYVRKEFRDNSFYTYRKNEANSLLNGDYDVVVSTYSPKSTHKLARYVKRQQPNVFWIADFRDPVYREFDTPVYAKWVAKSFSRRICKSADIITAVSQGCLDNLFYDSHPNKIVLPNGFDRDDIADIDYSVKQDKLTFSYLGSIYTKRQDLTVLFKVIHDLLSTSMIEEDCLRIEYAGGSKSFFEEQARTFGLLDIVEASDSVPREQSLKKQLESHILILATWNNVGEEGVITGKFYEYMMMDRPIIALVSGNLTNSKVKEMMVEGNLGVCYEEANKGQDEERLKEYILHQYTLFKEGKPLDFSPNREYVDQFDYRNITKQLISLFPEHLRATVDQEANHA